MIILGLDQALGRSGWAVLKVARRPSLLASGWFGVATKAPDTRGRVDLFRGIVRDLIIDYDADALAWEQPATFRSMRANLAGARLDEALHALAGEQAIHRLSVAASTWRAAVLGKGAGRLTSKVAKQRAVLYCHLVGFGSIKDENEAEAICIAWWAASQAVLA